MHSTIATVLAFAASAVGVGVDATEGFNRIDTPNKNEQLPAGKPYLVKWDNPAPYTEGLVHIQLLGGDDPNTLTVKTERLASIDNKDKEYTWNVDASLGDDATYGLRFVWENNDNIVQYSKPFHIKKGADADSSTVTMTSSQGIKTVTLNSASTSSSASSDSSTTTTTTTSFTSTTRADTTNANNSTTHTSTTLGNNTGNLSATTGPGHTTTSATRPSSGAAQACGSIAVVGGIVASLLAL